MSPIATFLPLAAYLLAARALCARNGGEIAPSLIRASVLCGSLVVAITEILGLAHAVTPASLTVSWILVCAGAALAAWLPKARASRPLTAAHLRCRILGASRPLRVLLPGIAVLVASVLVAAILAPPTPGDVQLYHMPRVLFWLQNRSVDHYPTAYYQQLFQPPWAEFAMLHLYALGGGDRFVSLVQCVAYIGSSVVAYVLTSLLGGNRTDRVVAAVFALTLPQGILTASGAKNDWPLTYWLLTAVYFTARLVRTESAADAVYVGLSAGLALLTKGTAYVWIPFLVIAAALTRSKAGMATLIKFTPAIAATALFLNTPHYSRNFALFGTPVGCDAAHCDSVFRFANGDLRPRALVSNLARNLALHATTPIPLVGQAANSAVVGIHRLISMDPNDPRTTWPGTHFTVPPFSAHEALAGNPVHLLLILGSALVLLWRRKKDPAFMVYAAGNLASFMGFCWVFRWQPWHTRLHLPFFTTAAPFVGRATAAIFGPAVSTGISVVLLMYAFPFALNNELRPLASPTSTVFKLTRDEMYRAPEQTRLLAQALLRQPCRVIGLDSTPNYPVYPLAHWLGIGLGDFRMVYLSPDPRFRSWYQRHPEKPCAVVYTHCSESPGRLARCRELGEGASYGELFLVTGFEADWLGEGRWAIRNLARRPLIAAGADLGDVAELPVTLRPDEVGHRKLLRGLTVDRWVTIAGVRIPVALEGIAAVSVVVRGGVPAWSGLIPLTVRFRCGDAPAHSKVLEAFGPFELATTVPCPSVHFSELEILPQKAFRPKDLGINDDPRQLSFTLREVRLAVAPSH